MTQPSQAFDLATVEHDLNQSLERLRTPALFDLPAEDRAKIADNSEQQALQPIRRRLEVEWQRRLVIERGENSLANLLTVPERREREQYIFTTALRQLLPLGRKLAEADTLLARLRNQSPPIMPTGAQAVDQGLRALAAADLPRALTCWVSAGEPEQVVRMVQERREQQGQEFLRQATAVFAKLPDLESDKERADLRTTIRREYIEPVRRIGTELQREKAQQVSSAVDAALNLGRPQSAAPIPPVPPAPADSTAKPKKEKKPQQSGEPRSRRALVLWAVVGALFAAVLFVLLSPDPEEPTVVDGGSLASPAASLSTDPVAVVASASTVPEVVATTANPAVAASAEPTPTLEATTLVPPTPTPGIVTTAIDPAGVYTGRLPAELTVRGERLDLVREAQLVPDQGEPIPLEIQLDNPEQMTLRLTQLPTPLNGELATVLYLNGSPQETLPIMVRDFLESKTVAGVKADYDYTNRIRSDGLGPYTTIHGTADANTAPVAPLRNGEQIEVLRDDADGWYEVRVRVSNDPAQIGRSGWIERWLIDDQEVPLRQIVPPTATPRPVTAAPAPTARPTTPPPPTARPTPRPTARPAPPAPRLRAFSAEVISSYPGSGRSEDRQSCIEGRVRDRNGNGVGGAVVSINNGASNLDRQTNGAGEFQFCGVGDSTWSVVLRYIPGSPGLAREVAGTVYVNGSGGQTGIVNFREQ